MARDLMQIRHTHSTPPFLEKASLIAGFFAFVAWERMR
ncbi:hypothetical protein C942_01561 [Photobacterium marinum]|uniref:Uncharacterized protein n=1 Tax=Photobacterium marinum TaxID=1056511 RepID=L8JFI8_9GAMM|nr:hypothetical protein C942_01561 [Photobacterium marinum]